MIKKTITYTDYNGNERTEDFYFNLSKAELTQMQLSIDGGLSEKLAKIIATDNKPEIISFFKDFTLQAYGEKSLDGKRFKKVDENGRPLSIAFSETEAYSILFMELATDAKAAAEFINGVIPQDKKPAVVPAN